MYPINRENRKGKIRKKLESMREKIIMNNRRNKKDSNTNTVVYEQ